MIADGVVPSNTHRGYILRRLLRRAVRFSDVLQFESGSLALLADIVVEKYKDVYPEIIQNRNQIIDEINNEETKFRETLVKGLKEFEKGTDPFALFTTYGFPIELTEELAVSQIKNKENLIF